ncbi:MAG TPA: hypothetical protein VMU59_04555 [Caulobacteraceae bacterium]|nr:hypothetical protein [Caulobacteraceae bacterium]
MLPDRLFYPLAAIAAASLVALALTWPQGQGAPPPPALRTVQTAP